MSAPPPSASENEAMSTEIKPPPGRRLEVSVRIGAETDQGKVRPHNEDHFLVAKLAKSMRICRTSLPEDWTTKFADEEGYLMVVADGMGGVAGGERASRLAVETVEAFILNVVKWFLHLETDEAALLGELRHAFDRADATVVSRARAEPRLYGMGTTLTMAYSVGEDLFLVHAGDSRAYLLRDGEFQQVTNDHTLVNLLVQGGALTPEAAKRHARRHVVTNVIGGPNPGVHTEVHRVTIRDGDVLLLCSDGLTEPLSDDRIAEVITSEPDPERASRLLIERALEAGAPDNVTVVLARYSVR